MPKGHIGHLVYCINMENAGFYRDLLGFLGWKVLYEDPGMLGIGDEGGTSVWFASTTREVKNDYDGPGLNHLGLNVEAQSEVDQAVEYLRSIGVAALFETPRHRPEFSGPESTYYQVMFESPDRLLFEIVYIGKRAD
jgi:catechol 2,3-dioxygenase-like lactoylglutathione lyase family enzyme